MGVGALELDGGRRGGAGVVGDARPRRRGSIIPRLLAFSFVGILAGQLGRLPIAAAGAKEAPLLASDALVVALLFVGFWESLNRRTWELDRVAFAALLFAGIGGLSALLAAPRFGLSPFQVAFSLGYLGRWLAYFGLYLLVINFVERRQVEGLWRALELTVVVFAVFGIIQSAFLPGFAQLVYPDAELYTQWDPQGRRLVSTFLDPNMAGALLVVVLLVQAARLTTGADQPMWRAAIVSVALLLTLSRSSLLAFVAGGLVLVVLMRRVRWRTLAAAGVVLLLLAPLSVPLARYAAEINKFDLADPSLIARFVAWARAWTVFSDHPFIGVGFNTYGFVQEAVYGFRGLAQSTFGLDGGLLFVAVMTGTLGLGAFLLMLCFVLRSCWRTLSSADADAGERALAAGAAAATVALLTHSMFSNSLLYAFLMQVTWVLWGLVFVASARPESSVDGPGRGTG